MYCFKCINNCLFGHRKI